MDKKKIECGFIFPLRRKFRFMRKGFLGLLCLVGLMGVASEAQTIMEGVRSFDADIDYAQVKRCAADNLTDIQAIGRMDWFRECYPKKYEALFVLGDVVTENGVGVRRYPIFAHVVKGVVTDPLNWRAPTDANGLKNATLEEKLEKCKVPSDYKPIGFCTVGCYAPGQALLFHDGWETVEVAASMKKSDLVTLSSTSTLEQPLTQPSRIKNWIFDILDAQQEILEFKMTSGGVLAVTKDHPILDHEGKMRAASTFKVGDLLVKSDGSLDPIESIVGKTYFGKAYNVELESHDNLENIVVAQGYLNGSLRFQAGDGVKKLNQALFRSLDLLTALIQN